MVGCLFCKIITGVSPSSKVLETEDVLVFNDSEPKAPIHVLVVPKKHIDSLSKAQGIDADLLGKLQIAAKDAARALGIENAYSLTTLSGKGAGQEVFHLHYHLKGGWKKKGREKRKRKKLK